jgi:hypothetical protein
MKSTHRNARAGRRPPAVWLADPSEPTGTLAAACPETGEPAPLDYWLPGALTLAELEEIYGGKPA